MQAESERGSCVNATDGCDNKSYDRAPGNGAYGNQSAGFCKMLRLRPPPQCALACSGA